MNNDKADICTVMHTQIHDAWHKPIEIQFCHPVTESPESLVGLPVGSDEGDGVTFLCKFSLPMVERERDRLMERSLRGGANQGMRNGRCGQRLCG